MKRLLLMIAMVFAYHSYGICEDKLFSIQSFGGIVDKIASDKIKDNMATDAVNVDLDRVVGNITKRRGYQKYNSTVLTGGQSVRKLYTYKQVDGDEYILANSSTSVFYSKGDGSFTAIISTLSASYTCDFATALDKAYFSNGSDNPYRWNGTTLEDLTDTSISTGMVKARFLKYHNNRMFYAGVDSYRSTVYYSEVNDPTNIDTFNYINVNVSDGENITGMFVWNGTLYIFKSHSTWTINEVSAGNFIVRNVSREIGCLYQDSIAEQGGFMTFLSHRGVEKYDGAFNLISEPIDTQIKDLDQLVTGENNWALSTTADWTAGTYSTTTISITDPLSQKAQDSVADWNAGTLVDIDTYTYSGSVSICYDSAIGNKIIGSTATSSGDAGSGYEAWRLTQAVPQSFNSDSSLSDKWWVVDLGEVVYRSTFSYFLSSYVQKLPPEPLLYGQGCKMQASNDGVSWTDVGTIMSAGDYYQTVGSFYISGGYQYFRIYATYTGYAGTTQMHLNIYSNVTGIYVPEIAKASGTFTSQTLDYGFAPESFGNLVASQTVPSGCDIQYQTRSSTNNADWSVWSSTFANGTLIPSTTAQYLQWKALLYSDTSYIYTPQIHSVYVGGAWQSEVKDFGGTPISLGNLASVYSNSTSTNTISYWLRTNASSTTLLTTAFTQQTAGTPVTNTPYQYAQWETRLNITSTSSVLSPPSIDSISLPYFLYAAVPTIGITYKDAYWLAVASDSSKSYNNMVYRYDKNGNWTKYSNMAIGGATISRNKLYTGSADNQGYVYEQDVKDRVTDASDESYDSYWQSKMFDMGMPLNDKLYKILYTTWKYQDTTDTPYVNYRLFIDTGTWTSNDVTYTTTGHHLQKTPMTHSKRSRYMQLKVGDDSDTDFEIMGIFGLYEVLPIR